MKKQRLVKDGGCMNDEYVTAKKEKIDGLDKMMRKLHFKRIVVPTGHNKQLVRYVINKVPYSTEISKFRVEDIIKEHDRLLVSRLKEKLHDIETVHHENIKIVTEYDIAEVFYAKDNL